MKKIYSKKQIFTSTLCTLAFTFASGLAYPRQVQTDVIVNNKNTITQLFGSSSSVVSNEIWSRVRTRLNLNATKSNPLMKRHINSFSNSQDYIDKVIKNATPYLFFILEEVEKRGMPSEIALLPIIESDFNPHTLSNKGALGLWQIMPSLGRMHGLKQNSMYDGRKDIVESTKVALDHLQYLHKRFNGNWLLAIAAYNCGEARLKRAIKENKSAKKSTDFWSLKLPKETTHFVPKLLALAAIVKSPNDYGVVLPAIANKPVFTRVNVGKPIDITHAAKLVDVSETQLRRLNPGIHKKAVHLNGPFHLLVPVNNADALKNKITTLPSANIPKAKVVKAKAKTVTTASVAKGHIHTVKTGESLPKISKKYKIKMATLLANNDLHSAHDIILPNQKLIIKK